MDHDGTNRGFACEAIARLSGLVNVPVIASGGAGKLADFNEVFTKGKADAALAAGVISLWQADCRTGESLLAAKRDNGKRVNN